jgi:hypothetical protein
MEVTKNECLQEFYVGQNTAEFLAIDYDENQLLVEEFSDKACHPRRGILLDVK